MMRKINLSMEWNVHRTTLIFVLRKIILICLTYVSRLRCAYLYNKLNVLTDCTSVSLSLSSYYLPLLPSRRTAKYQPIWSIFLSDIPSAFHLYGLPHSPFLSRAHLCCPRLKFLVQFQIY